MTKNQIILSFILVLMFNSCNDKKSQNDLLKEKRISQINQINIESNETFNSALLIIKDSGYWVKIDSVTTEFHKIQKDSAELGLKYAQNLKEYGFDLHFKDTDLETSQNELKYKINFNKLKVSTFAIEDSEFSSAKALTRKLSDYSTQELKDLPEFIRLTMSIVVPFDISRESLENTLKSIVNEKIEKDNDIDEIVIFAYDDKNDIGNTQYTFGKLLWSPNAKTGNMTPEIAKKNIRKNYAFDIIIKDKVGKITKSDLPTEKELEIYNEVMSEKYWDMQEEDMEKIVMRKFKIKSKKEFDRIVLKVGAYKLF